MLPSGMMREASGGGGAGGGRVRRCSHEDAQGPQDGGGWVRSICVATFDVGTGHTLEEVSEWRPLRSGPLPGLLIPLMRWTDISQLGEPATLALPAEAPACDAAPDAHGRRNSASWGYFFSVS